MTIDTNTMILITVANQNFSKVTNEDVFAVSERLIKQNMEAYGVLAK